MKDVDSILPAGMYFLIGFMGSGKSLLSKGLSLLMDAIHIEMDDEIERKAEKNINLIFEHEGEEGFRILEQKILHSLIALHKDSHKAVIISTGGGAPCFFNNMKLMNQYGTTIFLNPSAHRLARRLESKKENRPLVKDRSFAQIKRYVEETLEERKPWYNQANIHINMIYDDKTKNIHFLRDILLAGYRSSSGK